MTSDTTVIAYAKEVYASCQTIGFDSSDVMQLKLIIDGWGVASKETPSVWSLMELAMSVQSASILWAEEKRR